MSGYPSRAESEHDIVENSHASTAVSYAYGLAVARDATGARRAQVVAVIGDGALTGGLAYEALNNFGHSGRRAVIVLNDNGRCYAPTVSRLTAAAGAARRPVGVLHARSGSTTSARSTATTSPRSKPVLRDAVDARRPRRRARAHPQGRGVPPRGDRRREAPPRRRRVRSRDRRAGRAPTARRTPPRSARASIALAEAPAGDRRASPRACPAPPGCSRSRSASPTAASTSASPSSTRSPRPRAWRCAACARSWRSTPPS